MTSVDSRYEQENGSHLQGLYKEEDIEGVVPEWSIKYKKVLGELFIPDEEK